MILQDNPTDFEKHQWGFSERMKSAAWYLPCLGCAVGCWSWGRGAGRARQAFFSLTNEQVMRNTSKFKQNALWCSIIWLLGFFIAVSLSWTSKSKQWCLLFFNSWVYDDIKVSFSPLGLMSWESFRSAAVLFSTLAWRSVTQLGSAGRQEWAADLMGRGCGPVFL